MPRPQPPRSPRPAPPARSADRPDLPARAEPAAKAAAPHAKAAAPHAKAAAPHAKAAAPPVDDSWTVPPELHGRPIDGVLRAHFGGSWSDARKLIRGGKIRVAGELVTDHERKLRGGDRVELRRRASKPEVARARELEADLLAYMDASVVVVRKPAGISTVLFGDEEPGEAQVTLDALVRDVVAKRDAIRGRAPLGVVQRLDKPTSGLLVFARTFDAKKHLGNQLRHHTMHRVYWAIAHGDVPAGTITSNLVANRGDGLRGSSAWRRAHGRGGDVKEGQHAVTHVQPIERLNGATLIACKLETGRTHQIRVHLGESGHPLVGERVYVRDFGGTQIPAPRVMLHAAELGFVHPVDERELMFKQEPPPDFAETLERLRLRA